MPSAPEACKSLETCCLPPSPRSRRGFPDRTPEKLTGCNSRSSKLVGMDATDATGVLAKARQGDSEAFRVLVEQHSRRAFQLAYRMTGNQQDAEDVVQESFIRAYRQLSRFEARAHFGTWLHRIVANCSVDLIRSRRARYDHTSTDTLDAADQPEADGADPER